MTSHILLANLRRRLGATIPTYTTTEVRSWFAAAAPLYIDPDGLDQGITAWQATTTTTDLAERSPLISWLKDLAHTGRPLSFSTVYRERQGGRRHLIHIPGQVDLQLVGKPPQSQGAQWIQQIPRLVRRSGLRAAPGRVLILGDIDAANLSFLAAVARDPVLQADIDAGDPHQRLADGLGVDRAVGKLMNNALVGLITPVGLRMALADEGFAVDHARAVGLHNAWWSRYAKAAGLRDALRGRFDRAREEGRGVRIIAPDGRSFTFSRSQVRGQRLGVEESTSWKSVFSSIWRSIEGCVLDHALALLHRRRADLDLRLVITMFDGLVSSAPAGRVVEAETAVLDALVAGLAGVGVRGSASVSSGRCWSAE